MGSIQHIKMEIRNILRFRFLLIMAILIMVLAAVVPIIGFLASRQFDNYNGPPVVPLKEGAAGIALVQAEVLDPYPGNRESITVKGKTIYADNPFYWNLMSIVDEKRNLELKPGNFINPASVDLLLSLMDQEIDYYLNFASNIASWQDYRTDLAWQGLENVYELFFLKNHEANLGALAEVAMFRKGIDPETLEKSFINIPAEQRLERIDRAEENLNMLTDIVVNNNFPQYIDLRIRMAEDQIKSIRESIAIQEKTIVDNPSQEEHLSQYIEQMKKEITVIETTTIPMLEYRLARNIVPGLPTWQNTAILDLEDSRNQLAYLLPMMTEEEFNKRQGGDKFALGSFYSAYPYFPGQNTYEEYVATTQRRVDALNLSIIVAQKSLDTDRPDMKYVPSGSRSQTVGFLSYSMVVALFGVLLGGWLIASEYQQGTIRLLMIRPKTRSKILLAKFTAAALVWLAVDLLTSLINLITNGILYGFGDFAFPNYTVSGQIGFAAYFLPRLLACLLPILFSFAIAFMLSVIVKNMAVAIVVPVVFYIGSFILTSFTIYSSGAQWLFWTPFPFLQMWSLFTPGSAFQYLAQQGISFNLPYGLALLLVLSVAFTAISWAVFRKRDIVN